MAVSGANRGGRDKPVPPRSDGSWHLEDARKRREQRQATETTSTVPTPGEPEEDFSALALGLADNAMTTDGTPLSQLETRPELDRSDAFGSLNGNALTAEDIMRALEAGEHAGASKRNNRAEDPQGVHPPPKPRAPQGPHRRRVHAHRRRVIACMLGAAVASLLAVEATLGGGTTSQEQRGRSADSRAPTAALIAAATDKFLAMEHAASRSLGTGRPPKTPARRPPRRRHTRARTPSGSASSSTTTSSTSGTSGAVAARQQASPPSTGPPSSSTSSGSSQLPPQTQPHTSPSSNSSSSSSSSSSTPSKAALKSLVTGAGTCSCQ